MLNMPGELVTCQLTETVIKKYKKLVNQTMHVLKDM